MLFQTFIFSGCDMKCGTVFFIKKKITLRSVYKKDVAERQQGSVNTYWILGGSDDGAAVHMSMFFERISKKPSNTKYIYNDQTY